MNLQRRLLFQTIFGVLRPGSRAAFGPPAFPTGSQVRIRFSPGIASLARSPQMAERPIGVSHSAARGRHSGTSGRSDPSSRVGLH
jgi:hypothetical protein